tara:strand:- start:275 stop:1222 length:948 start_codon:yes stop_codon:yes gene_type:complete
MAEQPPPSLALSVGSGALAPALAAVVTNPADVAKTRLNMMLELQAGRVSTSVVECLRGIHATEGVAGLQRGLGFVLVREASKNAFRLGLFEPTVALLHPDRKSKPSTMTRVTAGAITGGLSAAICNPLDLLKTRIQLDPSRGAGTTASEALQQIVAAEGTVALWRRGVVANVARSALATSVGLPINARFKELWNSAARLPARPAVRDAVCAVCASAVVVAVINPIDLVRTRLFSQQVARGGGGGGQPQLPRGAETRPAPVQYSGVVDCVRRVAATEGVLGFWKGAFACFLRIGPHQTMTFVLIGVMQRLALAQRR